MERTIKNYIITKDGIQAFMARCLTAVGASENHAKILAESLMIADYRGHFSHGLNRLGSFTVVRKLNNSDCSYTIYNELDLYMDDLRNGYCEKDGSPEIIKESVATALVDGKNHMGVVVGRFCMDLAIKKAREVGIGWVVCRGSNHFGIADYYPLLAARQGLLASSNKLKLNSIKLLNNSKFACLKGFCCSNTAPLVATANGRKPFFGTNPLSVAAKGTEHEFVLDMATSVTAYGKVEIAARKGMSIPSTWAIDSRGKPTTDPKKFCALLPLGGLPETGGYKGTGLAMMIEVFSSVLSGSAVAPNVRGLHEHDKGFANLGQCFFAVNPKFFAPGFDERMEKLIMDVKEQEPAEGVKEILIAGEPQKLHEEMCDKLGGIPYHINQIKYIEELAQKFGVNPPKMISS